MPMRLASALRQATDTRTAARTTSNPSTAQSLATRGRPLRARTASVTLTPVAQDWFLKIDGIDGESQDSAHKGEIEVLSWSWGVVHEGAPGPGGGGGGASGKPSFQDFHFVAHISKASPKLFLSCATGVHHKDALLTGRRAGAKASEFLKYKLADVQVSS